MNLIGRLADASHCSSNQDADNWLLRLPGKGVFHMLPTLCALSFSIVSIESGLPLAFFPPE